MSEKNQPKPSCFIAMPISTPDPSLYHGDAHHFLHVLEHLFVPAVEAAGMDAIPPKAQGADIIQAEIIKHLETADLVLCDISTLNANVFFELGIRTALNKPVCIVRDDLTPTIPFDTTIVNHHTYIRTLHPWELDTQIDALTKHIGKSYQRAEGINTLWSYFGLTMRAEPSEQGSDITSHLALLSQQLEGISRRISPIPFNDQKIELIKSNAKGVILHDDAQAQTFLGSLVSIIDFVLESISITPKSIEANGTGVSILLKDSDATLLKNKNIQLLLSKIRRLTPNSAGIPIKIEFEGTKGMNSYTLNI